jgi:DNA-binding beta-propeller fold protein YncE
MLVGKRILAVAVAFWVSASALAQSNAYVLLSQTTSGSITPFHTGTGTLGASYFVPAGGVLMAIAPGSKQVWEVVSFVSNPVLIEVLDPESGVVLASIPIGEWVGSLTFDPAGRYAYVSAAGYLIKIYVASRTVVDMVASSAYSNSGLVAFSTDGSQLFLAYPGYPTGVLAVVDPVSLKTVSSVQLPFGASSILVSGNTLLVAGGTELLYLDTVTLEQTNSATVPLDCIVFAVSADGSEIYLYAHDFEGGPSLIAVLDFSTGTTLISQDVTIYLENVLMSPDGSEIVVAADPLLLIDSQTLAINRTVILVGTVAGAAFVDPKTVLLLNYAAEG